MSQRPPIRGVIFDMDGVLTDSEPLINAAAIAMFREQGLQVRPNDFLPFVGAGEDRYIGGVAELYRFPLDIAAAKRRTYEIYLDLVPAQLHAFPGAVACVQACRQAGLRVAVASSADQVKIVANLNKIGLPPANWEATVSAEDVRAKKPAPDLFLAAAASLGLNPEQCVVIEDAVNGVQAAKAAGMRCVAVCQTFSADQLSAADVIRAAISQVSIKDLLGDSAALPSLEEVVPPLIVPPSESADLSAGAQLPPVIPYESCDRRKEGWGFWATLGLGLIIGCALIAAQVVATLVASVLGAAAGHKLSPKELESNGLVISIATLCSTPLVAALCWIFARLRAKAPGAYLGLQWPKPKQFLAWCAGLLLLSAASDLLTLSLGRPLVPEFMERVYATAGFQPLLWLALVVAAPVSEEMLFRGFLFAGFQKSRVGLAGTIFITALIWSAIHGQYDLYGIATIFVAGVFLGLARATTGSVYATMLLHGLMNLIATIETACIFRFSLGGVPS